MLGYNWAKLFEVNHLRVEKCRKLKMVTLKIKQACREKILPPLLVELIEQRDNIICELQSINAEIQKLEQGIKLNGNNEQANLEKNLAFVDEFISQTRELLIEVNKLDEVILPELSKCLKELESTLTGIVRKKRLSTAYAPNMNIQSSFFDKNC